MITHTHTMLPDGMTRCWDLNRKTGKYNMTEEKSLGPYRKNAKNYCYQVGEDDETLNGDEAGIGRPRTVPWLRSKEK